MLFIGFGISRGDKDGLSNNAILGLLGVVVITILFMSSYIRFASIFNRTIKEIERNDSEILIKTYDFRIFRLFLLKGKNLRIDRKKLQIALNEFPMRENKKPGIVECYILRSGETEFYLLYKEFDDAVVNDVLKS
ncbi:hypothetical protein HYN56_19745 [Flavobacterium crocinum]|uniref:Uncharacterized protein n=2 Tax=Flavobacterium crocinum TaxID=2183896 RepID=A0A2S1YQH0_9FLAO|nr:hypothetical protein HYN56_19745 [Flavobacterium crocinum]